MRQDLVDNGYILVEDFLSPEQTTALFTELKDMYRDHPDHFLNDNKKPGRPSLYNSGSFLELLLQKLPFMSEFVGEQLFPTFCYSRYYLNKATLGKHVDRAACEVSISIHLGGDAEWKLFFEKPSGEEVGLDLKPGQGAVYLGCATKHWRENEYQGQGYGQVFLHYVRAKGDNRWTYFDKRR